jgi:hypothetical protein
MIGEVRATLPQDFLLRRDLQAISFCSHRPFPRNGTPGTRPSHDGSLSSCSPSPHRAYGDDESWTAFVQPAAYPVGELKGKP